MESGQTLRDIGIDVVDARIGRLQRRGAGGGCIPQHNRGLKPIRICLQIRNFESGGCRQRGRVNELVCIRSGSNCRLKIEAEHHLFHADENITVWACFAACQVKQAQADPTGGIQWIENRSCDKVNG